MGLEVRKVVLAYSGGLDTSVILSWLKKRYSCEVIAYTANIGQGEELDGVREKALRIGASKVYVEDLRKEFVEEYLFRALKANALYESRYLLGSAIARPLIAKRQVEIAGLEGADAVAHGATGKGNDQVRFELAYKVLNPELKVIAPWREWELKSREDEIDYAQRLGIEVPATKERPYSCDRNLWHLSYEGGILEDPAVEPPEETYLLSVPPEEAPDEPTYVEICFEKGVPKRVDGREYDGVELLELLNGLGGKNGIGRVDMVENRLVGMKVRGVYETPGGTILHLAHKELEHLTLDRDTMHYKELVAQRYGELIYYGQWFSLLREALDAFVDKTQERVTGTVRMRLYKGNCLSVARKSLYSLYREDLATFGEEDVYNQKDATGFIKLFGMPLKVKGMVDREMGAS